MSIAYKAVVLSIHDQEARVKALALMNRVERWQHEAEPSDPEKYLKRAGSGEEVKIVLVSNNSGAIVGACFVGGTAGFDLARRRAELAYCGRDAAVLDRPAVWVNYLSWEVLPDEPTALPVEDLPAVWAAVAGACRDVFPGIVQILVRARHREVWFVAHPVPPWELIAELDLEGFCWVALDGSIFGGYDQRFKHTGLLRLALEEG